MPTKEDEDEHDTDFVELWAREETPVLTLPLPLTADEEASSNDGLPQRSSLTLRQYPSDDDKWGIHSQVWDGGLAQLAFIHQHWGHDYASQKTSGERNTISLDVVDLGSGTGVLGLGLLLLNNFHSKIRQETPVCYETIILTDLQEAVPLLEENLRLNQSTGDLGTLSKEGSNNDIPCGSKCCVHELSWGAPELPGPIQSLLATTSRKAQGNHILVTGADIVYRQNLFEPLLKTMRQLAIAAPSPEKATFLFSSQSIRTHLHEFWNLAHEQGWRVKPKATVKVCEDPSKIPDVLETIQGQWSAADPWDLVKDKVSPGVVFVYELIPSFLSSNS